MLPKSLSLWLVGNRKRIPPDGQPDHKIVAAGDERHARIVAETDDDFKAGEIHELVASEAGPEGGVLWEIGGE